jgi:hypothetical protein
LEAIVFICCIGGVGMLLGYGVLRSIWRALFGGGSRTMGRGQMWGGGRGGYYNPHHDQSWGGSQRPHMGGGKKKPPYGDGGFQKSGGGGGFVKKGGRGTFSKGGGGGGFAKGGGSSAKW